MNEELRRRYVRDLAGDLQQVGGARFEQWLRPMWEHIAGGPVVAAGLNLQGTPVKGALDGYWPDLSVSEASSENGYFKKPYLKARHDFFHAMRAFPGTNCVRLFSTQIAGPTAKTDYQNYAVRAMKKGCTIDLWDGVRIAEYIVDVLLLDDRYVTRVGDALPNLRRIYEQNAASNLVPELSTLSVPRPDDEAIVITALAANKAVVLHGLGGIGKSELACAVARKKRDSYDHVFWADGAMVQRVEELRAHDIRLNGYKLNILGLLSSSRALLVLDNVKQDLNVEALAAACGPGSNVLVTSQVAFGPAPIALDFVPRELARVIISRDAATPCPDEVLDDVLAAVEGHPLVLRMLNRIAVESRKWDPVTASCSHIAGAADDKRQTVADRILSEHLPVLGAELSLFKWCGGAFVDASLFDHVFGRPGIEKLHRWSLTARGQSDVVRIHDLVFASVKRLAVRIEVDAVCFREQFEAFLLANIVPKTLGFFRAVHRHAQLIETLLRMHPQPGIVRYAYLHSRTARELEMALIGIAADDVSKEPTGDLAAWILSQLESIEVSYRRLNALKKRTEAKELLEGQLQVYERLVSDVKLPEGARGMVQHHKAKTLLKLKKKAEALVIFEQLLAEQTGNFASRLQVARLLESDPVRAKTLLFEIIEAELKSPGSVSTSVLLDTLNTSRMSHLKGCAAELTEKYGDFMASQLKAAACMGEDQPIRAFAAIGSDWAYLREDLFMQVLETIDVGSPEDAENDIERVAVARILCAAGKKLLRNGEPLEAKSMFELGDSFYEQQDESPTSFARVQRADLLLAMGKPDDAAAELDKVPDKEGREVFWHLRRAEAYLADKDPDGALKCVDVGLAAAPKNYQATFLNLRSDIRLAQGDAGYLDDLRKAIGIADSVRYRQDLQDKLERLQAAGYAVASST